MKTQPTPLTRTSRTHRTLSSERVAREPIIAENPPTMWQCLGEPLVFANRELVEGDEVEEEMDLEE